MQYPSRVIGVFQILRPALQCLFSIRHKAQGPTLAVFSLGIGDIVVGSVHGTYRFGDMVARVGYGEMAATLCEAGANLVEPR